MFKFKIDVTKITNGKENNLLNIVWSGERDVVLHITYLEMSDRDQMPSTFT